MISISTLNLKSIDREFRIRGSEKGERGHKLRTALERGFMIVGTLTRNSGKKILILLFSLLMFAEMTVFPASGEINGWEISPANPVAGDTLHISGTASPKEEVGLLVYFEEDVPVIGGTYTYELQNVEVPDFNNRFSVRAEGVESLFVRGKLVLWKQRSAEASGGVAVLSEERVPPGTYQLKLDGNAKSGETRVKLKVTALQVVKADSKGEFSYKYNTGSVPPGKYEITAGDYAVTVTLQPEGIPASDPSCIGTAQKIESSRTIIMPEKETGSEKSASITAGAAPEKSTAPQEEEEEEENHFPDSEQISSLARTPGREKLPDLKNIVKGIENLENNGIIGDGIYMLGGIGAGIVFLFAYSKKS